MQPVITTAAIDQRDYRAELTPIGDLHALERRWRELESDSNCEFFLSWSWIGPWLELVGPRADLQLFQCHKDNALMALAIVCIAPMKKRRLFAARTVLINQLAEPGFDMCIEYNGLIARQDHETPCLQAFIDCLQESRADWDELRLGNIPAQTGELLGGTADWLRPIDQEYQSVWIAALSGVFDSESIIGRLGKNRRWQIRRSFKAYAEEGDLTIDCAATEAQAQDYFLRMGVLHTERWQRAGLAGSFANPNWIRFHQSVIRNAFDRGEIQLLRICCGKREIGYIYNFFWRNKALVSQSGFATELSNVLRPGYTSHILAMCLNAQLGATHYNFLMGDSEYKRILGDESPPLTSLHLQQPRLKFNLENQLLKVFRATRHRTLALRSRLMDR